MIDPRWFGLIELLLVGGLAIGFGLWQLRSVSRDIARREAAKQAPKEEQAANDKAGR